METMKSIVTDCTVPFRTRPWRAADPRSHSCSGSGDDCVRRRHDSGAIVGVRLGADAAFNPKGDPSASFLAPPAVVHSSDRPRGRGSHPGSAAFLFCRSTTDTTDPTDRSTQPRPDRAEKEVTPMQLTDLIDAQECMPTGDAVPCRENDAEIWFADTPAGVEFAKALCGTCPTGVPASRVPSTGGSPGVSGVASSSCRASSSPASGPVAARARTRSPRSDAAPHQTSTT